MGLEVEDTDSIIREPELTRRRVQTLVEDAAPFFRDANGGNPPVRALAGAVTGTLDVVDRWESKWAHPIGGPAGDVRNAILDLVDEIRGEVAVQLAKG